MKNLTCENCFRANEHELSISPPFPCKRPWFWGDQRAHPQQCPGTRRSQPAAGCWPGVRKMPLFPYKLRADSCGRAASPLHTVASQHPGVCSRNHRSIRVRPRGQAGTLCVARAAVAWGGGSSVPVCLEPAWHPSETGPLGHRTACPWAADSSSNNLNSPWGERPLMPSVALQISVCWQCYFFRKGFTKHKPLHIGLPQQCEA